MFIIINIRLYIRLEHSRFFNIWKWSARANIFPIEEKDKLPNQESKKNILASD